MQVFLYRYIKSKLEEKNTYRPCRSAIHEVCIHSNLNFLRSEKSDFVKVISISILSDKVINVSILIRAVASTLYKQV